MSAASRPNAPKRKGGRKGGRAPQEARDKAMRALLDGSSQEAAAAAAGVDRHTISAWMAEGHEFRAEYDTRHAADGDALDARRRALRSRAMDRVAEAIAERGEKGLRVAVEYLRLVEPKRVEQSGPNGEPQKHDVTVRVAIDDAESGARGEEPSE